MCRIAFFCIPAWGHTNPTLQVVKALTEQGHAVEYYSFPPFREAIEAAGARFVNCDAGDIGPEVPGGDVARDILASTRLMVETTLRLEGMALKSLAAFRPDVIVADSVALWGRLYAMKLGVPCVCSTTTFAFNKESAKVMRTGLRELIGMLVRLPRVGRMMKPLRAAGYPVKGVMDILNSADMPTVVYTSRAFQPCAETFSDHFAFVGPCPRPVSEPMEKPERPLVYVSMGTVLDGEHDFYRSCAEAFRDGEYEVILSVGESRAPADPPENVHIYKRVDQIAVLRVADAFITHCGMNSASEALYCGVPLVTRPLTPEEGGVANRAERLGAALRLADTTPEAIRAAVDAVLGDAKYRRAAQQIGEGFHKCGGAEEAARVILKACVA